MKNIFKSKTNAGPVIGLAFALCGAAIATVLGVPAAALVGGTLATTVASVLRLKPSVPKLLRNLAFAVIGGTLGSGITPHFLQDVQRYPVSLGFLAVSMVLTILLAGDCLRRWFGVSRATSVLATSPGAMTYSLSLAADGHGDIRAIMVLQSVRLLLITVLMPPLLVLFGGMPGATGHAPAVLGVVASLIVICLSAGGGYLMERFKAPAAWLLAGLIVSGIGHGLGLISGRFANSISFVGFTIAGAVIGSRFAGIGFGELKRLAWAGLASTGLAFGVSALVAFASAEITGIPFAQMWIAFAPGGVEGMSAMALAMNFDPVFVATHHIFRIVSLIVILPLMLKRT